MTAAAETVAVRHTGPGALSRTWASVRHHLLTVYAALALGYLFLPIGVVVLIFARILGTERLTVAA